MTDRDIFISLQH